MCIQGGWFAQDSPYFGYMLPVIGHSLTIFVINQLYSKIAKWCTDNENHRFVVRCYVFYFKLFYRDVHSWHNSLIFKRVLFECADCYLPLFYIAFYQFNVVALRNEMIGLFYSMYVCTVLLHMYRLCYMFIGIFCPIIITLFNGECTHLNT